MSNSPNIPSPNIPDPNKAAFALPIVAGAAISTALLVGLCVAVVGRQFFNLPEKEKALIISTVKDVYRSIQKGLFSPGAFVEKSKEALKVRRETATQESPIPRNGIYIRPSQNGKGFVYAIENNSGGNKHGEGDGKRSGDGGGGGKEPKKGDKKPTVGDKNEHGDTYVGDITVGGKTYRLYETAPKPIGSTPPPRPGEAPPAESPDTFKPPGIPNTGNKTSNPPNPNPHPRLGKPSTNPKPQRGGDGGDTRNDHTHDSPREGLIPPVKGDPNLN